MRCSASTLLPLVVLVGAVVRAGDARADVLLAKETGKLVSSDGLKASRFGGSIAIRGTTAVIGSAQHSLGTGFQQGAAYVFTKSGTTWTEQAKLVAADGKDQDNLGHAVALDGDTAVATTRAAAYVFVRSGTTWTQQAKVVPTDFVSGDSFGASVALQGDRLLVAAGSKDVGAFARRGVVYVFTRSGATWVQEAKLMATDGATDDLLGNESVAFDGTLAVASATGKSSRRGAAYVFARSGTTWTQQAKLVAADGKSGDAFGRAALSGTTIVVSAFEHDAGALGQGAAYVFGQSGATWTQQAKLVAADARASDRFGYSVALSGSTAYVGRPTGAAYVFTGAAGAWTQKAKLTSGATIDDEFGSVLAVDGATGMVAADRDTVGANEFQGTVHVYGEADENGDACAAAGECVSGFCVHSVCCETECAGQCASGKCVDSATCSDQILTKVDGTTQNCAPYKCAGSACLAACTSSDDCVAGAVCDATSKLCVAAAAPVSEDEGGCATHGSPGRLAPAGILALLGVAVGIRAARRAPQRA